MVKILFSKIKHFIPIILVFIGWVLFLIGNNLEDSPNYIKSIFLSIARVLP